MSSHKPATTNYPLAPLIAQRWSPRAFSDKDISLEEIGSIIEAARWSASCFNAQPWQLYVGSKTYYRDTYNKIFNLLVEFNQTWAQPCPLLILTVAKMSFPHNGKPNAHAWHDVGMASAQMMLQAEHMGLSAHAMAGFDIEGAYKTFNLPSNKEYQPVSVIAFGHATDASVLPKDMQEGETALRERRAYHDIVK
jgi:nitroreductase